METKNKILFTNGLYEFTFDKPVRRIKNIHIGKQTRMLSERNLSVFRALLILREQGKAFGRFEFEYVRQILGEPEGWQKWTWHRNLRESALVHLESIRLYNFIVLRRGKAGFLFNENIRVIIIDR